MKRQNYLLLLILSCFILIVCSCGAKEKNEPDKPDKPNVPDEPTVEFTVPESVLMDETANKSETIDLKIEGWTATADADWVNLKQEGSNLILSAAMWTDSPKGTKQNVQEREDETREAKVTVKIGSTAKSFTVKQENIYVGKFAQGGIIYWLNTGEKIAEGYPDCKGLVLSVEESPCVRPFFAYDLPEEIKNERNSAWVDKWTRDFFKDNFKNLETSDGVELTQNLLATIEKQLEEEKGVLPPYEQYMDWNFLECPKKDNSAVFYAPNYVWFKNKYWKKQVNGYSDWYIASKNELLPMFKWEEFLFLDIIALFSKKKEENPKYGDVDVVPFETKYVENISPEDRQKGHITNNYFWLRVMTSSGKNNIVDAISFIQKTDPTTAKYSFLKDEKSFNSALNAKGNLVAKLPIRPVRRF